MRLGISLAPFLGAASKGTPTLALGPATGRPAAAFLGQPAAASPAVPALGVTACGPLIVPTAGRTALVVAIVPPRRPFVVESRRPPILAKPCRLSFALRAAAALATALVTPVRRAPFAEPTASSSGLAEERGPALALGGAWGPSAAGAVPRWAASWTPRRALIAVPRRTPLVVA